MPSRYPRVICRPRSPVEEWQKIMYEPMDTICDVEEAIADLEAMSDVRRPDPRLVSEIQPLDHRLWHIQASEPVFSRLA